MQEVTDIHIYMKKTGSVAGTPTLNVYYAVDGFPSGDSIGTSTITGSEVTEDGGWVVFNFAPALSYDETKELAVAISVPDISGSGFDSFDAGYRSAVNHCFFKYASGGDYHLGTPAGGNYTVKIKVFNGDIQRNVNTDGSVSIYNAIYAVPEGKPLGCSEIGCTRYFNYNIIVKATDPTPADESTGVSTTRTKVYWQQDYNLLSGTLTYNIYFGEIGNMELISEQEYVGSYWGESCTLTTYPLVNGVTYQWRVDGITDYAVTTGDTWTFTVGGDGPAKPINPTPAHEQSEFEFDSTLSWEDGGGATSYNVYVGVDGDLTLVSEEQETLSFVLNASGIALFFYIDPETHEIVRNSNCYWRVDAVNEVGTTTGDIWWFDPKPTKPINPTPENETSGITLDWTEFLWE